MTGSNGSWERKGWRNMKEGGRGGGREGGKWEGGKEGEVGWRKEGREGRRRKSSGHMTVERVNCRPLL